MSRSRLCRWALVHLTAMATLGSCSHAPPGPGVVVPTPVRGTEAQAAVELFNGKDLSGWVVDVPEKDENPGAPDSFVVRDGLLVSLGTPRGHLLTKQSYKNYRLTFEYRFVGAGGNGGVLIHASTPRVLYKMFPQSIEVQLQSGDAGDFWCIHEDISVENMEIRRPREQGSAWGGRRGDARRILNLTDGAERPLGEWNAIVIEAVGTTITVWVNGQLVNRGSGSTASEGQIALQAEGTEMEFRKLQLVPLGGTGSDSGSAP
ncbi:MAG: DUF1080 domain-containing protein [Myxococcales bacterium]|nr:DUF1080 domain-containing protein [Myxococcales bacterium]